MQLVVYTKAAHVLPYCRDLLWAVLMISLDVSFSWHSFSGFFLLLTTYV